MSNPLFANPGIDAQKFLKDHLSASVKGEVNGVELEPPETTNVTFSVIEDYHLKGDLELASMTGLAHKTSSDVSVTDNPAAFLEAVTRLLNDEIFSESVAAQCDSRIKSYKYLEHRSCLAPLLLYRSPRRVLHHQGCKTCGREGQTQCIRCDSNGQVTCQACGGSARIACTICHGKRGHFTQEAIYQNGQVVRHEQRWNPCSHCIDGYVACYTCLRTGKVNCFTCGGGKWLSCQPCSGTGWLTQIATPVLKATYSVSYRYPSDLDEVGQSDLGRFLDKTDWQVHEHASLLRTDYERDNTASIVRVKHCFEAPWVRYHAKTHRKRAQIRQFGNRYLFLEMGRIMESLVSSDLEELQQAVRDNTRLFSSTLLGLKPALRNVVGSRFNRELMEAINSAPDPRASGLIADSVNRSVGANHVRRFTLALSDALGLVRRRRRLVGGACLALTASLLALLSKKLVCAYPGWWFFGEGCTATAAAAHTALAINAAQLGAVAGLVIAICQLVAQAAFFDQVSDSEVLKTFAKRIGGAQGPGAVVASLMLGGLIAFGVAKVAAPVRGTYLNKPATEKVDSTSKKGASSAMKNATPPTKKLPNQDRR